MGVQGGAWERQVVSKVGFQGWCRKKKKKWER